LIYILHPPTFLQLKQEMIYALTMIYAQVEKFTGLSLLLRQAPFCINFFQFMPAVNTVAGHISLGQKELAQSIRKRAAKAQKTP